MEWEAFKKKQETEKAEASTVIKVWALFHTQSTLFLIHTRIYVCRSPQPPKAPR